MVSIASNGTSGKRIAISEDCLPDSKCTDATLGWPAPCRHDDIQIPARSNEKAEGSP
jgi:hypothetical protein